MNATEIGLSTHPPALVVDRRAANSHYASAIQSPQLDQAIELRARALQMRAELTPIPAVPLPPSAEVDLNAWVELAATIADAERARTIRDEAIGRLIASAESTISSIASSTEPALARLNQALQCVMEDAAQLVSHLNGCHNAAQIVAAGDDGALAAYQELRRLRAEYDSVRAAQDFLMTGDPRADRHRSEWLYDDELATDLAIANLDQIFPRWKRHQGDVSMTRTSDQPEPDPRPWPNDPVEQMIWLVVSPAKPWVPTKVELRQLGERRMAERAHAGGAPSRRPARRPNQRERRVNRPSQNNPSILLNEEISV